MKRGRIDIKNIGDWESICDDILCDFVASMESDDRFVFSLDPECEEDINGIEQGCSYGFTLRALTLIERYIRRLSDLTSISFPLDDANIKCSSLIEY